MKYILSSLAVVISLTAADTPAYACGGCFTPPQEVSVVSAHRMVFSISKDRTILWDQLSYAGDPREFAWVLPVHATGLKVELAHDEFISALDSSTTPVIIGPSRQGVGGFSVGCGGSDSAFYAADDGGVQVLGQEVVGPYEVSTLRSTDANALTTWLTLHSYTIPDSIKPTVAAYVGEGFDFIALRLLPGKGVSSMQPIRIITPGAGATLPLRMVAAGVGANVSILLYVISEGRYEAANYFNTEVDFTQLRWLKDQSKSNYNELVQEAMTRGDGRNFTIEFGGSLSRLSSYPPNFYQEACPEGIWGVDLGRSRPTTGLPPVDGGSDAASEAGVSDGGDAGATSHTYDACEFDDLTVATEGMNKKDIFITRLRANLKVAALSQDLVLKAAADQSFYDNVHTADMGDGCSVIDTLPDRSVIILSGAVIALLIVRRRRRS